MVRVVRIWPLPEPQCPAFELAAAGQVGGHPCECRMWYDHDCACIRTVVIAHTDMFRRDV